MPKQQPIQLQVGNIIKLKKPHPCGGYEWRITRLGTDVGLSCLNCGRHVMLPRTEVMRRLKSVIEEQKIKE